MALAECQYKELPDGIWLSCGIPEELEQFDLEVTDPLKPADTVPDLTYSELTPQQISAFLGNLSKCTVDSISAGELPTLPGPIPGTPDVTVELHGPNSVDTPEYPTGSVNEDAMNDLAVQRIRHSFFQVINSMRMPELTFMTLTFPEKPQSKITPVVSSFLTGNPKIAEATAALDALKGFWNTSSLYGHLEDKLKEMTPLDSQGFFNDLNPVIFEQLINRIFEFSPICFLSDMGIAYGGEEYYEQLRQKYINAFQRDVEVICNQINRRHRISLMEMAAKFNEVRAQSNKELNDAVWESYKSRIDLSLLKLSEAVLIYNLEVGNAIIDHLEYKTKMQEALKKAEHYFNELDFAKLIDQGNQKVLELFRKQVDMAKQIFEAWQQEMELSEDVIKLRNLAIEVENANLENELKVQEGLLEQANNELYYQETLMLDAANKIDVQIEGSILQVKLEEAQYRIDKISRELELRNNTLASKNIQNENLKTELEARLRAAEIAIQEEKERVDAWLELQNKRIRYKAEHATAAARAAVERESLRFDTDLDITKHRLWETENYRKQIEQLRINAFQGYINAVSQASEWRRSAAVKQELIHLLATA